MEINLFTTNPEKMEESFGKLMTGLYDQSKGKITFTWEKIGTNGKFTGYLCKFGYPMENRVYNSIIMNTFESTVRKIDPEATLKRMK